MDSIKGKNMTQEQLANLKPFKSNKYNTADEIAKNRERQSLAGRVSQQIQRKNAKPKWIMKKVLETVLAEEKTAMELARTMVSTMGTQAAMFTAVRDTLGYKPVDHLVIDDRESRVVDPFLENAEVQQLAEELEATKAELERLRAQIDGK